MRSKWREFMVGIKISGLTGGASYCQPGCAGHASLSSTPLVPRGASASRREDAALASCCGCGTAETRAQGLYTSISLTGGRAAAARDVARRINLPCTLLLHLRLRAVPLPSPVTSCDKLYLKHVPATADAQVCFPLRIRS